MTSAARRGSWDAAGGGKGGLTFSQTSVGVGGGADVEGDMWDDGAILKAFDDALSTHSRKPGYGAATEPPKYSLAAAQSATANHKRVINNRSSESPPRAIVSGGRGVADSQGYQQADSRLESLLAKESAEAVGKRAAGIPGPWEPVVVPREGEREGQSTRGMSQEPPPRTEHTPGPYDFGAHHHPYGPPRPSPASGGAPPNFSEGWDRYALPPPPQPPVPPLGTGIHAAAFQSLDGVHDDELADLLLAWYYSGYYTGRFRAMQENRSSRFRRPYPSGAPHPAGVPHPPGAPSTPHGPPPGSHGGGGEGWERQQGWNGYVVPPGGPIHSSPSHVDLPGVPVPPRATGTPEARSGPMAGRRAGP